uniref:Skp1 domain-containing protein n=1 Tax=Panagrellus redivivus TaxID=6233 RepID=A0A7E4V6M9_PANRE
MNAEGAPEIEVIVLSSDDEPEEAAPEVEVIVLSSDSDDDIPKAFASRGDRTAMEAVSEEESDTDPSKPTPKALLAAPGDDPPPEGYYKLVAKEGTVYLAPAAFVEGWKEFQLAKEFCEPFGPADPIPVPGLTSETLNFVLTFYAMYEDKDPYEPPTGPNVEGRIEDEDKPSMAYLNKATLKLFDQLDTPAMHLVMNASCFFEYKRLQDYCIHYLSKVLDPMEEDEFQEFVVTNEARPTAEEEALFDLDPWEVEKNMEDAYNRLSDREKRALQRQKRKLEMNSDDQPSSSKKARNE